MGMNVYAYAKATNGQEVPIMYWRKPYALADWLLNQLSAEARAIVNQQEHQAFVISITAEMLAMIEAKAHAEPDSVEAHVFWVTLDDAYFFWRAQMALGEGFEVSIMVDP